MYKSLGLSSEMVTEIGRWKNFQAFHNHYMRLGAAKEAGKTVLSALVHKVSPGQRAESDRSRTPETEDPGGSDLEDEAQRPGEPIPALPGGHSAKKRLPEREIGESPPRKFSFAKPKPPTAFNTALTSPRARRNSH